MNNANKLILYNENSIYKIPQIKYLNKEQIDDITVVSKILPFRVNNYVLDNLIDWNNIPQDPIFQLVFPQKQMLSTEHYSLLADSLNKQDSQVLNHLIKKIRLSLNPHPAGQMTANVPSLDNKILPGFQHKYSETLLYFPPSGQTCHSYCTFCFRWAQFVGDQELKIVSKEIDSLKQYLKIHPEITDILITGGDPLIAKTTKIQDYIVKFLSEELANIRNIRIGTKALTYWPQRFLTDPDADDLLRLFETIVNSGKHLAIMAHYNHPHELSNNKAVEAIKRIQNTGAVIRSQGPLLANINDNGDIWANLWNLQISYGIIPYYMFVERDTGAQNYFKVTLPKALAIYRDACKKVGGLARTARGPSMSTSPGKVLLEDIVEINHKKYYAMKFIQARDKKDIGKLFFIKYDPNAVWYDNLEYSEFKFQYNNLVPAI